MIIISLVIITGLAILAVLLRKDQNDQTPEQVRAWEHAVGDEKSAVGRILLGVAKPIARSSLLQREASSPAYKVLQKKLVSSSAFSSSVEVYLAVQTAAFFLGALMLAFTILNAGQGGPVVIGGGLLSVALVLLPWNSISKRARDREKAVLESLPDFAELLQMPLASGMGVLPALSFTADRVKGPVSDEVRWMTTFIANNPTQEAEAFLMAGDRLGTPESKSFFTALLQAQMEGSRVAAALANQAESLRKKSFERQRAEAKKLPIKLVLMFGLHFLPLLFILALLPVFLSFGKVL